MLEKHANTGKTHSYKNKTNIDKDLDFFEEELPKPKPHQKPFSYSEFSIFPDKEVKQKQNPTDNMPNDFADFDFDSF